MVIRRTVPGVMATLDAVCRELRCQPGDLLTRFDGKDVERDGAERRKEGE